MTRMIWAGVMTALLAGGQFAAQKPEAPETLLQAAIKKEVVDGNLAGAIDGYKKALAAAKGDRVIAVQALMHMAECYQKLGDAESRKIWEQVVREYADQRDAVATARARLGDTGARAALAARQLWTGNDIGGTVPFDIAPTADGQSLLFTNWGSGDIGIRDMETGNINFVGLGKKAPGGGLAEFAQFALYSPDRRQIAVTWLAPENGGHYDFRIISTQPGAKLRVLIQHPELTYFKPFAWSPDGKSILTLIWKKDATTQIAWVSAADGSFKTLKSLEWREPQKISLSTDGRFIAYDALERNGSADRSIFILAADGSSEATAVSGPGIHNNPVWAPDGSHLIFTSNRSRNVGLYAATVRDGKVQGGPQLLKPDVGPITLSGFVRSGALYYLQPTGDQNVHTAELDAATGKLLGAPAPLVSANSAMNSRSALSPDGTLLAYLSSRGGGSIDGGPGAFTVIVKSLATQVERSFPTSLDLIGAPYWFADGRALMLGARSQPSGGPGRNFFRLDLDSGAMTILNRMPNQASGQQWAMSPDGETVYTTERDTGVGALSLPSGQFKTLYPSPTDGLVGALALSPDGRTLAVSTGRTVRLIDTQGGGVRTLFDSRAPSGITWSSDGKHILFVRGLNATESEVWRVPVDGGEPAPTGIRGRQLRELRGGPNELLTYTAGSPKQAELWALDNLLPMVKATR